MVRKERENAQKHPKKLPKPKIFNSGPILGTRAIYSPWHTSQGPTHLVGSSGQVGGPSRATADVIVTLANSSYSTFQF